jgi:hypothetical protein
LFRPRAPGAQPQPKKKPALNGEAVAVGEGRSWPPTTGPGARESKPRPLISTAMA